MLTADDGVQMRWSAETDEVEFEQLTRTPPDVEAGFTAAFRQFYLHGEDASYAKVHRLLRTRAEIATDSDAPTRLDELSRWAVALRMTNRQSPLVPRPSVLVLVVEAPLEALGTSRQELTSVTADECDFDLCQQARLPFGHDT